MILKVKQSCNLPILILSRKQSKNAKEHQIDTIAIIGGDGTIHHALQTFVDQLDKLTVAIIPGGTVNNFARMLGIPLKPEEAFETILNGTDRQIDYGLVNDSMMISTMTIGLLADTAAATSQEENNSSDHSLYQAVFPLFIQKETIQIRNYCRRKTLAWQESIVNSSHVQFSWRIYQFRRVGTTR